MDATKKTSASESIQEVLAELAALRNEGSAVQADIRRWTDLAQQAAASARELPASRPPPATPPPPAPPPVPPPPAETLWHYAKGGRPAGPIPQSELCQRLARGDFPADIMVWRESMPEWVTALAAGLVDAAPPPRPVKPPPPPSNQPPEPSAVCAQCGTALKATAKFCIQCGREVSTLRPSVRTGKAAASACPSCAEPVRPGTRFCTRCGARLG